METPHTPEGCLTDKIMAQIVINVGSMPVHQYNRTYEAVLEVLQREAKAGPDLVKTVGEELRRHGRLS